MENQINFDFPEELGGHVMDITFSVDGHQVNIIRSLMYTSDPDDLTPIPIDLTSPKWRQHLSYINPFLIETYTNQ